jgi:iron complex outermembrane receptor protein
MSGRLKYTLLVLALCLLFTDMHAQMIFDTLYLDETEIISFQYDRNDPATAREVDTLVKAELNHLSLAELLSAHTPVFVKAYGKGTLATASFRGTAASHTKVLWDGFEINSPMLGQVDLSLVPNNFYSRAVLNYGGSSLENTTGALGGAINLLNTDKASAEKISFAQTAGSFKTFSTSLNVNLGNDRFRSLSSVHLTSSDNTFRFYNNAIIPPEWQDQDEASYYNRGFTQAFVYHPKPNHEIKMTTWDQWNYRQIPPIMSNQGQGNHKEEQNSFTSRNILQWNYHKSNTLLRVKTAWFYEDFDYLLLTTTTVDPEDTVTFIQSLNKTNSAFVKMNLEQRLGNEWTLTGGLDAAWHRINSNNYEGLKKRDQYGLFVKAEKSISGIVNLEFLLRQQYVDDAFTPPAPFAGISVKPFKSQELYVRFNGNYNYNLPGLNDLYWYPGGNENLQPEKGFQYEGGIVYIKYFSRTVGLSVDASAYDSYIHDWIQWVPTDYRYWTARNIGFVHARGLEANLQLNGYAAKVRYKFIARYSFTKSTNESDEAVEGGYDGRQLIYVPLHSGNVFAYATYRKFELTWNTEFTGKRNTSLNEGDLYSNVLPFYSLSNVSFGKKFDVGKAGLVVKFKVNNVFNVSYQAVLWRAMPGVNYEVFVLFTWK